MLVDGALRDEAVRDDLAGLAHAPHAGHGLTLGGGLELGLHEDHDLSRLEVDADAPGLDLQDDEAEPGAGGEAVDHGLALLGGKVAVDAVMLPGDQPDVVQDLPEEGEEHDLPAFLPILREEVAEAVVLRRLLPAGADGRGEALLHEVHRSLHVGFAVRRLERDDFVDLLQVRQFLEHILLGASQIHGRQLEADFDGLGARLAQEAAQRLLELRLHREDEVLQFLQSVLQRGAGEEGHMLGAGGEAGHGLAALGFGILDRVGLVHRDEVHRTEAVEELPERGEGGDGDATLAVPLLQLVVAVEAMDDDGAELRVLADFALPVDEDRIRGDHEEPSLALGGQVAHRGQHLHGLAQAHVVAQQRPTLVHQVLGAEELVTPQGRGEQRKVERRGLHRVGDLGRQPAALVRRGQRGAPGDRRARPDPFEQGDETGGVFAIAPPGIGLVDEELARETVEQAGFGEHPCRFRPEPGLERRMGRALRRREEVVGRDGAVAEERHFPTEGLPPRLQGFGPRRKFPE